MIRNIPLLVMMIDEGDRDLLPDLASELERRLTNHTISLDLYNLYMDKYFRSEQDAH